MQRWEASSRVVSRTPVHVVTRSPAHTYVHPRARSQTCSLTRAHVHPRRMFTFKGQFGENKALFCPNCLLKVSGPKVNVRRYVRASNHKRSHAAPVHARALGPGNSLQVSLSGPFIPLHDHPCARAPTPHVHF